MYQKLIIDNCNDENFYCYEIIDNKDGLTIKLSSESNNKNLIVKFDKAIGYRNFDEGDRLFTLDNHPEICVPHSFFMSRNSELINWLRKESNEMYCNTNVICYLFATPDDIIEVLSLHKPVIDLINT